MSDDRLALVADKHEIETLQRLYAKATDLIGHGTAEKVAEAMAIMVSRLSFQFKAALYSVTTTLAP
ncbi:MAG: hypothetical protein ACNYPE_13125 [Candidatus Azotimanducaceae bacterium WSBS_2022_MAG_OTU7]